SIFFVMGFGWFGVPSGAAQTQVTPNYAIYSTNAPPQSFTLLGVSVAADGNLFAVGASFADTVRSDIGQVYIYNAITGVLLYTIDKPDSQSGNNFGAHVALSGTRLAVTAGVSQPSVYVFDLGSTNPTTPVLTLS